MVRIKSNTVQNYLIKAAQYCDNAEYSESLYNCWCGLESLTSRLWKKLGQREFKTEFPVVIRTPNGQPDLMSVVSAINSFLKKVDPSKEFSQVVAIFDYLLGLEAKSNISWTYLNKGTHDEPDKPEFDQLIIREIVKKLMELDATVKGLKKSRVSG